VPRPTQVPDQSHSRFAYRAFTSFGRPSQCRSATLVVSHSICSGPTTPTASLLQVWALPRSLAATQGISSLISFPPGTEMVQFPGSPSH
jgi:hypothetical protein